MRTHLVLVQSELKENILIQYNVINPMNLQ